MIDVFKSYTNVIVYKFADNSYYQKDFEVNDWDKIKSGINEVPDVIFRHGRDTYPDNTFKDKSDLKICYGGYEGKDPDAENGEENIYRSIMNMNYLNHDEVEEMIKYLENQKSKLPVEKPSFLMPPTYNKDVEEDLKEFHQDLYKKYLKNNKNPENNKRK